MSITIYKTLMIAKKNNINSYKEFLEYILKDKTKLISIINNIIDIFLCATYFIMISGFGTYLNQAIGLNKILGSIILAFISYIIFLKNIESITKVNDIIIPILITIVFIVGIENMKNLNIYKTIYQISDKNNLIWIVQAILYASYNLILLIPVLINLKKLIKNKKQIIFSSIGTGIIMSILSIFVFLLLANVDKNFEKIEMPIIYVINNTFNKFNIIYGIAVLIAIFTTAISVGIVFLNNMSAENNIKFKKLAMAICVISVLVSPIGFSNLIGNLFPLFGFLGLIEIFYINMRN